MAASLLVAVLVSGCSGGGYFGGPSAGAPAPAPVAAAPDPAAAAVPAPAPAPSRSGWLRGDFASFFSSSSDTAPQAVAGATADMECPYMQVREGASTLTISAPGDNAAMSLRYQGTFVRAARQCAVVAGNMVMKVGVEGRIILGPAGVAGEFIVPLRIAIVDESPATGTKTIVTKLINVPVVVRSMDDNPTFAHVEDGLAFHAVGAGA